MKESLQKTQSFGTKKSLLMILLILIVIIVVVAILELTNTTHIFHKQKLVTTTIKTTSQSSTTKKPTASSSSNNQKSSALSAESSQNSSSSSNAATLVAPSGSFVSNHKPGQNGSNMQEESLCTGTPGAICYIQFTQDNTVKTLPKQTLDANGSTIWDWDIKQNGLTSGSWQVEAVSTLNGQSKSTSDPITLEVQ